MTSTSHLLLAVGILFLGLADVRTGSAMAAGSQREHFEGWLHYQGEFVLYATRADMRAAMHENCISGAFPLKRQRAAPFGGQHVVITGYRGPWLSHDGLTMSETWHGSAIENWCRRQFVIFATGIRLKRP